MSGHQRHLHAATSQQQIEKKTTLGGVKVFDPDFVLLEILRP